MEIGLQDDPHFLDKDAGVRGAAFAHARSLRASSLRANVAWASVVSDPAAKTAPAVVSFDFSRFDRLIDEAASNGIRVQLTLTATRRRGRRATARSPTTILIRSVTRSSPRPPLRTSTGACVRCRSGTSRTGTGC